MSKLPNYFKTLFIIINQSLKSCSILKLASFSLLVIHQKNWKLPILNRRLLKPLYSSQISFFKNKRKFYLFTLFNLPFLYLANMFKDSERKNIKNIKVLSNSGSAARTSIRIFEPRFYTILVELVFASQFYSASHSLLANCTFSR